MSSRLEDYDVLDFIGCGSFGVCKKVRRKVDKKVLAWKEMNYGFMTEAEKQLLVSEVNVLRELRHPHIVRYYGRILDPSTTTLYIIMEYCEGGDLGALIRQCRRDRKHLEEEFIWNVIWQLAKALQECHTRRKNGRSILHRDLKPANVFLDSKKNIKLGDFGVARVLSSDSSFAKTVVGTPCYMSPEQMSKSGYNEKSDIWSLGCLVHELCSLVPPFSAMLLTDKIDTVQVRRIPPAYSTELNNIIRQMLTAENESRPSVEMLLRHPRLVMLEQHGHKQCPRTAAAARCDKDSGCQNNKISEHHSNAQKLTCEQELREKLLSEQEKRVQEREAAMDQREAELIGREKLLKIHEELVQEKMERVAGYFKLFEQLGVEGVEKKPKENGAAAKKKKPSLVKGSVSSRRQRSRRLRCRQTVQIHDDVDRSVREADTSADDYSPQPIKVKEYLGLYDNRENRPPSEASFHTRMSNIKSRLKSAQQRALRLRTTEIESRLQSLPL